MYMYVEYDEVLGWLRFMQLVYLVQLQLVQIVRKILTIEIISNTLHVAGSVCFHAGCSL